MTRPNRHTRPWFPALVIAVVMAASGSPAGALPVIGCQQAIALEDDRCEDWVAVHDDSSDASQPFQTGTDLAVDPTGSLVVTLGYGAEDLFETGGQARSVWQVIGLDAQTGAQQWLTEPGPDDRYARPVDLHLTADGRTALATGYASSAFGERDAQMLVVAIDVQTGEVRWEQTVDSDDVQGSSTDVRGWFVRDAADGSVVVAGTHARGGPQSRQGLLTVVLDAGDGAVRDVLRTPGVPADGTAHPGGLVIGPDGTTAAVAATSDGAGEYNIDMVAYGIDLAAARVSWVQRVDGRGARAPDRVEAVTASPDGSRLLMTGISGNDTDGPPFDVDYDTTTLAIDTVTGEVLWESRQSHADSFVPPAAISTDGTEVVLAGNRTVDGEDEGFVTVLDAVDGVLLRDLPIAPAGPDAETIRDATLVGDEVVLTGRASRVTNGVAGGVAVVADVLTIAVGAQDGSRRWTARHNLDDVDDSGALRVVTDPSGGAYVLSSAVRNLSTDEHFRDMAVAAYRATPAPSPLPVSG